MSEGISWYSWPANLVEDMVANGDTTYSTTARAISSSVRHLCGWGHSHGTANWSINAANVILASSLSRSYPIRLGPYARDLELRLIVDGAGAVDCVLNIAVGGVAAAPYEFIGRGTLNPDDLSWSAPIILPGVGTGKSDTYTTAAEPNGTITFTAGGFPGANIYLFYASVRELHNTTLDQGD